MRFKTVTLIGSGRFEDEFLFMAKQLTRFGYRVLSPVLHKDDFTENDSPALVPTLRELMKENIEISDLIYVVDPDHYIGESTENEIRYAMSLRKPIRYYSNDFDVVKGLEDAEMELIRNVSENLIEGGKLNLQSLQTVNCSSQLCKYCPEKDSCTYKTNE